MSSRNGHPLDRQVGGEHYLNQKIQPSDIVADYNLNFWEGNALYMLLRRKDNRRQDQEKAIQWLELNLHYNYQPQVPTERPTDNTQEQCTISDRTLIHVLRHTFDRHELDVERNTAGDMITALRKDEEDDTASNLISFIAGHPTYTTSMKLDALFRILTEGAAECTSCGG